MQDLISILVRAILYSLLETKIGLQLAIAAMIAFASGMAVSMLTRDVVAARWAFFAVLVAYLALVSAYAIMSDRTSPAASDCRIMTDTSRTTTTVAASFAAFLILAFAVRALQGGLELLGLPTGVAFWLSWLAYLAAFLALMLVSGRRMSRGNGPKRK